VQDSGDAHHGNHLCQRRADNDRARHAEQVDQCRHHDETAAYSKQCAHKADEQADDEHWNDADVETALAKSDPPWKPMDPIVLAGLSLAKNNALALLEE